MDNHDTSSSGESITLYVEYDQVLARLNFEDFEAQATEIQIYRDQYLYILGDTTKPFYKVSELRKMNKAAIIEEAAKHALDFIGATKEDLIAELKTVTIRAYYEYLCSQYSWHDLAQHIPHEHFVTRGYCQGDEVRIVSVDEELTPDFRREIGHIFWDHPVYISLQVNGEDVEIYQDDPYEYDRDNVISQVKATGLSEYVQGWVIEHLPEMPEF